jgi:hypothetical protein
MEFFSVLKPMFRPIMSTKVEAALLEYMSKKKIAAFYHNDGVL